MKNQLTELVFILDRSGSMAGLEADTVGGFNAMMEKQKATPGKTLVSTVLFDTEITVLHDRVPLAQVPVLTNKEYYARGCTALLDAVGGAIRHIGNIHKYTPNSEVPGHTLFVITTDGMENASRRYGSNQVKAMIERQKERYGWEFLFLGANIDAVETAKAYGISEDYAVTYHADSVGTRTNFEAVNYAARCIRADMPLQADWKGEIEKYRKKARNRSGK